jgi:hypothetical protein
MTKTRDMTEGGAAMPTSLRVIATAWACCGLLAVGAGRDDGLSVADAFAIDADWPAARPAGSAARSRCGRSRS